MSNTGKIALSSYRYEAVGLITPQPTLLRGPEPWTSRRAVFSEPKNWRRAESGGPFAIGCRSLLYPSRTQQRGPRDRLRRARWFPRHVAARQGRRAGRLEIA